MEHLVSELLDRDVQVYAVGCLHCGIIYGSGLLFKPHEVGTAPQGGILEGAARVLDRLRPRPDNDCLLYLQPPGLRG